MVLEWLEPKKVAIVLAVLVVIVSVGYYFVLQRPVDSESFRTPDAPPNVVLVHQLGHGVQCPSLSPFVVKLETYLRANNIPYKSVYDRKMGPKGKVPWIEYNGDVVADSSFIIEYLNRKFDVNTDAKLTSSQRGVAKALQRLAEESLYFQLGLWRAVQDPERETFKALGLNWFYLWILERKANGVAWQQGIGRHTEAEVTQITDADLQALSNVLGEQEFFMGSSVSEVDFALFGQLSQWLWQAPRSPAQTLILEKYPNLKRFCERIKGKYWADWNELILQPPDE